MTPKRLTTRVLVVSAVIALLLPLALVEIADVPPRDLARYVERRASGHNPMLVGVGDRIARELRAADRGADGAPGAPPALSSFTAGARDGAAAAQPPGIAIANPPGSAVAPIARPPGVVVPVATAAELVDAVSAARPGQAITLAPGVYRLGGRPHVAADQPGREDAPITVRADVPGTVLIELDMTEGFRVTAPWWTFEHLHLRGVCGDHANCEHAFHVVGKAAGFVARNNTVTDFNAHFKINGEDRNFPDGGTIAGNTIVNQSVRETDSPVTPIDIVGAGGWKITGNVIADFVKGRGDQTSYGAFAKGGGADTSFERNVVICEHRLRGLPGQRVGLSIGGGGSEGQYCRAGDCAVEHFRGTIGANLVQSCSDDGIYVNRGEGVAIMHNTLLDTGGISIRYPRSDARVEGNLVDGLLRVRDGGAMRASDNFGTRASQLYFLGHPVRELFVDFRAGRLEWKGDPPRRARVGDVGDIGNDLCGSPRPARPAYGAIEDFSACLRR